MLTDFVDRTRANANAIDVSLRQQRHSRIYWRTGILSMFCFLHSILFL